MSDLLVLNHLAENVLKGLLRVDHVDDDCSLEDSVVERHPFFKGVLATSYSANDLSRLEDALDLHGTNEVVLIFDENDGDSDVLLLD